MTRQGVCWCCVAAKIDESIKTLLLLAMPIHFLRAATLLRPAILVAIASRAQSFVPAKQLQYQTSRLGLTSRAHLRLASSSVDNDEDIVLQTTAYTTFESNIDEDEDDEFEEDINADNSESDQPVSSGHVLYEALLKSITTAITSITKKKASLQNELAKAQSLEATMNRANLIVSNLYQLPPGTTEAAVQDWQNNGNIVELVLNAKEYATFQEESDGLFAAARKMKRGSAVVEDLLAKTTAGEETLNECLIDLNSSSEELDEGTMLLIQEKLKRTSKITGWTSPNIQDASRARLKPQNKTSQKSQVNKSRKPNPRELTSPSGHKVLVGRNRRDNEAICFQLSKPTDTWLHARGCPGAHVLLCIRRGSPEVTEEDFQFAANLAAFYSDARTERRAEVTTAEPKHITKPRGAPPGAVTLRQEGKTLLGRPDDVPEELKEARELSGANWSELGYRKLGGRAKNKKRTAALEKETARKRREEARENNKRKKRKEESDWF